MWLVWPGLWNWKVGNYVYSVMASLLERSQLVSHGPPMHQGGSRNVSIYIDVALCIYPDPITRGGTSGDGVRVC